MVPSNMLYKLLHLLPFMLAVQADAVPAGQATARAAVRHANAQDVALRYPNSDTSDTDVKINILLGADDEFLQLGFRYRHSDSKVVEPLADATFIPEQGRNHRWRQGSSEPQNTLDGLVGAKFRLNTERRSDAVEGLYRAGDEVQGERTMLAFLFRPPFSRGIDHRILYVSAPLLVYNSLEHFPQSLFDRPCAQEKCLQAGRRQLINSASWPACSYLTPPRLGVKSGSANQSPTSSTRNTKTSRTSLKTYSIQDPKIPCRPSWHRGEIRPRTYS